MLNTYIKNRGSTKTIIHDNGNSHKNNTLNAVNEIKWDASYDGDIANISITSDTNGEKKHFNISLDNNDLEHILNVPSVDMPIHKRLKMDFSRPEFIQEPTVYKIGLPQIEIPQIETPQIEIPQIETPEIEIPQIETPEIIPTPFEQKNYPEIKTIEQMFQTPKQMRYLSTPLPNEELIIPVSINKDLNYNLTPKKRHRNKKTHKTYKVLKKHKTSTSSKSNKRSSKRRSNRNSIRNFTGFL
jgi:hypothetical protein